MKAVEPCVLPLAHTAMDRARLQEYLDDIGATEYENDAKSDLDALIEVGGKQCYRSWQPGLNPNVSRVRTENAKYLANINAQAHGAVREHGSITFVFWNVSRVFTHELVRHRVGIAISQESLRFVRLTNLGFWIPPSVDTFDPEPGVGRAMMTEGVEYLEGLQQRLAKHYGIEEMTNFTLKKKLTSMFRRVAPIGLATSIVWTGNINILRHCIQQRTSRHAEEEIRIVFDSVAEFCRELAPNIFADFHRREVDGIGEWWATNGTMPYDQFHMKELVKSIKAVLKDFPPAEEGVKELPSIQKMRETLLHWGHLEDTA